MVKINVRFRSLVLVGCFGALASCSGTPTRQAIEKDEDAFCRAVAKARQLETRYGINKADGGEAGAKP